MKKKILLAIAMVALLVCVFAISISAETVLKPQTSNAYGELSFFDESISVGRTNTNYGFTPYMDAEGTTYARIVVGDGTTFYTFPTAYALSNSAIYGSGQKSIMVLDLVSLNSAMQTATGTNPNWSKTNVYRIELPKNMQYLNAGNQNFSGWSNIIEIYLQPESTLKDTNKNMVFWKCHNLETIHNLDTFVFRSGSLGGAFQECKKLTNITIGVSTEITTTGDNIFNGCTNLQSVNFKEAFPNLTTVGKNCFYGCTNLTSTSSEEKVVALPSTVTKISESAFYECKAIKYVSLPASLTYVGAIAFINCTALEFVDFNDNVNDIEFYNYGHFMGCTSLKAVSLSDNIQILNNRIFNGCSSLEAVYLPKNLVQMNTNGNGQGPFCYSKIMYFVNEPFEVRDENGNFYGDKFVMPAKPEVYFMPETLTSAGGNASSGTWFRECLGLNTTIVMPKAFTNSTVVQMFRETANASNIKNVVYLGDMESIAWSERNHHINFVFANPNDKDISSVTFSNFYNNLNSNCYFYFCSTGNKYTMAVASEDKIAGTLETNAYCHIANPKKTESVDATCVDNKSETTYCFCGTRIGTAEVENTALGHEHDVEKGSKKLAINYSNYLADGSLTIKCTRCAETKDISVAPVISSFKGFSVKENGKGITFGYTINYDALDEFVKTNGSDVEIGFVVALSDKVQNNAPALDNENVISAKIVTWTTDDEANSTLIKYTGADFKLVGDFTGHESKVFCMAGYLTDGDSLVYLNNGASGDKADTFYYGQFFE